MSDALVAAVRAAVIDWNTLGKTKMGNDVSTWIARALLPVVEQEIAAARAEALREAADRMPAWGNSGALEFAQDWLRDRAARIARTAAQTPATSPEEGR